MNEHRFWGPVKPKVSPFPSHATDGGMCALLLLTATWLSKTQFWDHQKNPIMSQQTPSSEEWSCRYFRYKIEGMCVLTNHLIYFKVTDKLPSLYYSG